MIHIILTFIEFILIINKIYFQTNSIYEQELVIEMKQKYEMFRNNMYIMFEKAYKMNENVCVTYIQVSYYLNK